MGASGFVIKPDGYLPVPMFPIHQPRKIDKNTKTIITVNLVLVFFSILAHQDSNLDYRGSEPRVLPLDYAPLYIFALETISI